MRDDEEQRSVARPSLRDWYAEGAVFLASGGAAVLAVALTAGVLAGRSPVVDGGAVLVGGCCGIYAARRFRARRLGAAAA